MPVPVLLSDQGLFATSFAVLTVTDEHLTRPPHDPTEITFLPFRFSALGFVQTFDDGRLLPFFNVAFAPKRVGFPSRLDGEVVCSGPRDAKIALDEVIQEE